MSLDLGTGPARTGKFGLPPSQKDGSLSEIFDLLTPPPPSPLDKAPSFQTQPTGVVSSHNFTETIGTYCPEVLPASRVSLIDVLDERGKEVVCRRLVSSFRSTGKTSFSFFRKFRLLLLTLYPAQLYPAQLYRLFK